MVKNLISNNELKEQKQLSKKRLISFFNINDSNILSNDGMLSHEIFLQLFHSEHEYKESHQNTFYDFLKFCCENSKVFRNQGKRTIGEVDLSSQTSLFQ